ncbi:MAG: MBL fold metallo-hydrolase [Clostridia bacterium]|nr:MBL fold metallo-hydrolase [Clostridia bacterium]
MIKICPLFSGSSGNCTYAEFEDKKAVIIDCGKSAKQIEKTLHENGLDISNVKGIFITHEHTDHVSGLKVFSKRYGIKIYGSKGTITNLKNRGIIEAKSECEIIDKKNMDLGFASLKAFSISHDCSEGFGFVFTNKIGEKFAMCTDLGFVSNEVKNALTGANIVMLESNHDVMMLQNGPYPYYLKKRILSSSGHLSNQSCAEFLPHLVDHGTKNIILAHLSSHNNIPELAMETSVCHLSSFGMSLNKDFHLNIAPKINTQKLSFSI